MTACRINHNAEGSLPAFLCRACHPELNLSSEERTKLDEADAKRLQAENAEVWRKQELMRTQAKLDALEKRIEDGRGSTIDEQIASSLRTKIERLDSTQEATVLREQTLRKRKRRKGKRNAETETPKQRRQQRTASKTPKG